MTWAPWNPVSKKKTLPNDPSHIANGALAYSLYWAYSNKTPKRIVTKSVQIARDRFPSRRYPLERLRVAEDQTRVTRLNRGTPNALIGFTPTGGHEAPVNAPGTHELWAHDQKNLKKKHTSDTINRITAVVRQAVTPSVWIPQRVPSRMRSWTQK